MQNTENFNLKVYDGEDLFNPLTVENVNMNAIDTQMKKNENHAVGDATELVSGTVHAITRLTPDAPMLRFTATSRFTVGDTFTVDGVQVSALTVSGEQLPDGAYIIGSEVLAYLKGTLLTVFTSQGTLATAQNALKLGGNDPEYYATASAVQTAQETATAAGNLANEVNNSLANITNIIDKSSIVKFTNCTNISRWRCHVIPINEKVGLCVLKAVLVTSSTTIQYTIPKSVYGVDINAVMTGLGIPNMAIPLGTNGADGELYTGQRTGLQANGVYEINDTYLTSI